MKSLSKFDQVISIEVSVDSIYQKLMGTFPEDYKHKEILSHAIVGGAVQNGGIAYVYNALNGYTNDVDFQVGDLIISKSNDRKIYKIINEPVEIGKKPKYDWDWQEIGECEVIEINMYATSKLHVKFMEAQENGEMREKKCWIDHKKCTKVQLPEAVAILK